MVEKFFSKVACYSETNDTDIKNELAEHLKHKSSFPVMCFLDTEATPEVLKRKENRDWKTEKRNQKKRSKNAPSDLDLLQICFYSPLISKPEGLVVFLVRLTPKIKIQQHNVKRQRAAGAKRPRGEWGRVKDGEERFENPASFFPTLQKIFKDPKILKFIFGKDDEFLLKYGFKFCPSSDSWFDVQMKRDGSGALVSLTDQVSKALDIVVPRKSLQLKQMKWNQVPLGEETRQYAKKDPLYVFLLVLSILKWPLPGNPQFLKDHPWNASQKCALAKIRDAMLEDDCDPENEPDFEFSPYKFGDFVN